MMKKKVNSEQGILHNTCQLYNLRQLKVLQLRLFLVVILKVRSTSLFIKNQQQKTDLFTNHMSRNIIFTIDNQKCIFFSEIQYFFTTKRMMLSVTYDLMYQKVITNKFTLFKLETLYFIYYL